MRGRRERKGRKTRAGTREKIKASLQARTLVKPRAILTTAMEKEEEEERRPGVRAGTRSLAMPGATKENPGMEKRRLGRMD